MQAWMLYWKCEPWGYQQRESATARMRATMINCTPRGENAKAINPVDLLPRPYGPPEYEE